MNFFLKNYLMVSNGIAAMVAAVGIITDPENNETYIPDFLAHLTNAVAFKFRENSTLKNVADLTNLVRLGFLAKNGVEGNYGAVEAVDTVVHASNIIANRF